MTGPVGIVAALAAEARTLGVSRRALRRIERRSDGLAALADGSLVAVSGMGCEAAARSARSLVEAGCGALASWGLAGGLDPALRAGTVVAPETVLLDGAPGEAATLDAAALDAAALNVAAAWRERLVRALAAPIDAPSGGRAPLARLAPVTGLARVTGGRLLTCLRPLASRAEKQDAHRRTGAVAVDTESYAVAEVAAAHDLPFLAVRVIVDTAGDEVPGALAGVVDARGRIDARRLLLALLSQPAAVGALLKLSRRYGAARMALRAVADGGVVLGGTTGACE